MPLQQVLSKQRAAIAKAVRRELHPVALRPAGAVAIISEDALQVGSEMLVLTITRMVVVPSVPAIAKTLTEKKLPAVS